MQNTPFSRFAGLMAAALQMVKSVQGMTLPQAVSELPGYKSRGKGRGSRFTRLRWMTSSGRRYPMNGAQERARRLRQGGAITRAQEREVRAALGNGASVLNAMLGGAQ